MQAPAPAGGLAGLARSSGAFGIVAADQRYALRAMFRDRIGRMPQDDELTGFKTALAECLSGHASAMLFDVEFGRNAMRTARELHPDCGLIASLDRSLVGDDGLTVRDTTLDRSIELGGLAVEGVAAAKLLVFWRGKADQETAIRQASEFTDVCRAARLVSVLEVVVKLSSGDVGSRNHGEELVAAAKAVADCRPDLYKTEVPLHGQGGPGELCRIAEKVTEILPCPWVVLSTGIGVEEFPGCVQSMCQAGASGFLAGRAIWADAVGPADFRQRLMRKAVPRLERLNGIVDRYARPRERPGELGT